MNRTFTRSKRAMEANTLVEQLQRRFVDTLERVSRHQGHEGPLASVQWLRDQGRHGGGMRFVAMNTPIFDRASVNVSQVHYDDRPEKRLGSATALSCIIHPRNPHAPSIHMHVSWTEMRDGAGYWRIMADLNPSIPYAPDTAAFTQMLERAAPQQYAAAMAQGDRYFYIPALGRHRGVAHFYLEGYRSSDPQADFALARRVAESTIDHYGSVLETALKRCPAPTAPDVARQLEYHTLYLFQVLTLDRGTTSGLLVHDQNDRGILGSLPSHVDRSRLRSWRGQMPVPQGELLDAIVATLPYDSPSEVSEPIKLALARVVRRHYAAHPQALELQASADVVPPTVANHK